MMDNKLNQLLTSRGIIINDDPLCGYHFASPWDATTASRLGLRYFGTPNKEQLTDWQLIDHWGDLNIYENRQKPTLVSLRDMQDNLAYVKSFAIAGNNLTIQLPLDTRPGKLIVALTARPGFMVTVDGVKRPVEVDEFGFFSIAVTSADRIVTLSYNPLNLQWLL